jgi:hypothetical protein
LHPIIGQSLLLLLELLDSELLELELEQHPSGCPLGRLGALSDPLAEHSESLEHFNWVTVLYS